AKLGRLFRLSLNRGRSFITFAEEMEHAAIYAQIQQARFKASFLYEESMDPAAAKLFVPKLIIQPLIENAIVHGFRRDTAQPFRIRVGGRIMDDGTLCIEVEDNGIGLAANKEEGDASSHGLRNVRQRIRLYCGNAYGVRLVPREEGGVRAVVTLPALTEMPSNPLKGEE